MMIIIGARSLVAERKVVLVPEGLSGERVDAAVARMLGLSRSHVAELIGAGRVLRGRWLDQQIGSGPCRVDARGRARR